MHIWDHNKNRNQSFIDLVWNESTPVSVEELSEAGFYYTGEIDGVEFYHCSLHVYGWAEENSPCVAHAKYSPNSHFLKFHVSNDFIEECQRNYWKNELLKLSWYG
jgi:hypothetical protein